MCETQACNHVVDCGTCRGSGRDSQLPLIKKCTVCEGVGKVLLK